MIYSAQLRLPGSFQLFSSLVLLAASCLLPVTLGSIITGSVTTASAQQLATQSSQISVEGIESFTPGPSAYSVSADFSLSAREAGQTSEALDARIASLIKQVTDLDPDTEVSRSPMHMSGPSGQAISKTSILVVKQRVTFEVSSQENLPKLVDILKDSEAELISPVEFVFGPSEKQFLAAQDAAITTAMNRAESAASRFGMKLGPVLSSSITEIPMTAAVYTPGSKGQSSPLNLGESGERKVAVALTVELVGK